MTTEKLRAVIACVAITAACNAFGSNWIQVGRSSDGTSTIFVDASSIAFSGGHAKAWFLNDNMYSLDAPTPYSATRYVSNKTLALFDCDQRTSAVTQTVYYDDHNGGGKVVWSWSVPPAKAAYSDVIPDTLGEAMLDSVCSHRSKEKHMRKPSGPTM